MLGLSQYDIWFEKEHKDNLQKKKWINIYFLINSWKQPVVALVAWFVSVTSRGKFKNKYIDK